MKKAAVITGLCLIVLAMSCRFYFKTTTDNFSIPTNSTSIQNGKNLTHLVCGGCHFDPATKKFTGKPMHDLPGIGGKLVAANLTHSTVSGATADYTDAKLFYLIKTGIAKDGSFMPYMMRPMTADEDINDIISYLRSDDIAVAADDHSPGQTHLNALGKMFVRIGFGKPTPYNKGVARPDENDELAYGRYLVAVIGCYHCHSSSKLRISYNVPEHSKGYMEGGIAFKTENGKIRSVNLTPDNETGIGSFSLNDFSLAVRNGMAPNNRKLRSPMPKFPEMNDKEVRAIYNYLKSLPAVHHKAGTNL
ncbi:MAG TPA: hypothetical protein VKH37_02030 [Ferruginibacter sp.]|nr:hypothetical protein [Ferruginibacter sp.]